MRATDPRSPAVLPFRVRPITPDDAVAICHWRYPGPYAFYDYDPRDWPSMVSPDNAYVVVAGADGSVAGFVTVGANARVPGAEVAGLYQTESVDIGLGMRPDLTGRGFGSAFLATALEWTSGHDRPETFRLVVATFNLRAIRTYERAGFVVGPTFDSPVRDRTASFLLMTRPATLTGDDPVDPEPR